MMVWQRHHKKINNYVPPSTKRRKPFPQAESRVKRRPSTMKFSFHLITIEK
jgi:hypothetical protein